MKIKLKKKLLKKDISFQNLEKTGVTKHLSNAYPPLPHLNTICMTQVFSTRFLKNQELKSHEKILNFCH